MRSLKTLFCRYDDTMSIDLNEEIEVFMRFIFNQWHFTIRKHRTGGKSNGKEQKHFDFDLPARLMETLFRALRYYMVERGLGDGPSLESPKLAAYKDHPRVRALLSQKMSEPKAKTKTANVEVIADNNGEKGAPVKRGDGKRKRRDDSDGDESDDSETDNTDDEKRTKKGKKKKVRRVADSDSDAEDVDSIAVIADDEDDDDVGAADDNELLTKKKKKRKMMMMKDLE